MAVVAWPPPTPPNTRANATAQVDAHPLDHDRIADALDTLISRVGGLPVTFRWGLNVSVTFASGTATYTLAGAAGTALAPFPTAMLGVLAQMSSGAVGPGGVMVSAVNVTSKSQFQINLSNAAQAGALPIQFLAWGN